MKTKELLADTTCLVEIWCNNGVHYTPQKLADSLNELRLPLNVSVFSDTAVRCTYHWVLPPGRAVREEVLSAIINNTPHPSDAVLTITF